MGRIIEFRTGDTSASGNLIVAGPWEFRRPGWENKEFLQVLKTLSVWIEKHPGEIDPHYILTGARGFTIKAAYSHRDDERQMREIYYLAGLIDCMTNRINPLLRTDLIRDIYNRTMTLKERLNIHWYGSLDEVLLPIDSSFFSESEYKEDLGAIKTMKALYRFIRQGTDRMFDLISREYLFYIPGKGI